MRVLYILAVLFNNRKFLDLWSSELMNRRNCTATPGMHNDNDKINARNRDGSYANKPSGFLTRESSPKQAPAIIAGVPMTIAL